LDKFRRSHKKRRERGAKAHKKRRERGAKAHKKRRSRLDKFRRSHKKRRERGAKARKKRRERGAKAHKKRRSRLGKLAAKERAAKKSVAKKLRLKIGQIRERASKRKKQRQERRAKRRQTRKQRGEKRTKARKQRSEKRGKVRHARRKKSERRFKKKLTGLKKLKLNKLSVEKKLKYRLRLGLRKRRERSTKNKTKRSQRERRAKAQKRKLTRKWKHFSKKFKWNYGRKLSKQSKAKIDDCKKIAERSCKQIEDVVSTDQKILNRLGDGSKCLKIGVRLIRKSETNYQRVKKLYIKYKVAVSQLENSKVAIPSQRLDQLTKGKCGFVFRSSAYIKLRAKVQRMQKLLYKYQAQYKAALKEMKRVKIMMIRQRKKCLCHTKRTRDKTWATITHSVRRGRLASAHKKCKLMQCVEKNIPFSSPKCAYRLPKLVLKKLTNKASFAHCNRLKRRM